MSDDTGKEGYSKAQLHSDCVPHRPVMELEGSYPKLLPEMTANEVPAQELPNPHNRHVAEMPEKSH